MPKEHLTIAEIQVLSLVDAGFSNQQIAIQLAIVEGTVKCHLHHIFDKLQARSRTQAVMKAREYGFITRSGVSRGVNI